MIDWETVQIVAAPSRQPDSPLDIDGSQFLELPETGFDMLIAALAGAENLVRTTGTTRGPVIVTETRDGVTTRRLQDWTAEDDEIVEEGITSYLDDAGIAPPPRGYTWFLGPPAGRRTAVGVVRLVNGHLRGSTATYPHEIREEIEPFVRGLYAAG